MSIEFKSENILHSPSIFLTNFDNILDKFQDGYLYHLTIDFNFLNLLYCSLYFSLCFTLSFHHIYIPLFFLCPFGRIVYVSAIFFLSTWTILYFYAKTLINNKNLKNV